MTSVLASEKKWRQDNGKDGNVCKFRRRRFIAGRHTPTPHIKCAANEFSTNSVRVPGVFPRLPPSENRFRLAKERDKQVRDGLPPLIKPTPPWLWHVWSDYNRNIIHGIGVPCIQSLPDPLARVLRPTDRIATTPVRRIIVTLSR